MDETANSKGSRSVGGVFLFDDFCENLIVDRYDVGFLTVRGAKTDSMRRENSEDAHRLDRIAQGGRYAGRHAEGALR
jgi:hypothetical protein